MRWRWLPRDLTNMILKDVTALILRHTLPSRSHLTPELALRLVTSQCPLWNASEDECPFKDPFWAFYWPGGQATARYILDNGDVVRNSRVLDVGCGCGAGAIAAAKMRAACVVANDIDKYAVAATNINAELNVVKVLTSTENLIGTNCEDFDTILIGDMFYDEEFANKLFGWLYKLCEDGKSVLIGDPGRHGLTEKRKKHMKLVARYDLPAESCIENNGFTETTLWRLNKY